MKSRNKVIMITIVIILLVFVVCTSYISYETNKQYPKLVYPGELELHDLNNNNIVQPELSYEAYTYQCKNGICNSKREIHIE